MIENKIVKLNKILEKYEYLISSSFSVPSTLFLEIDDTHFSVLENMGVSFPNITIIVIVCAK